MSPKTLTVPRHTPIDADDCPVLAGDAAAQFHSCIRESSRFSLACLDFLKRRPAAEQAAWLKRSVDSGRAVFQPWTMELVYVIATLGKARFGQLAQLLGLSSRTLSDKLQFLQEAGLVDRQVFDEKPVRIEYFLTKDGRATAALASPLIAHLNQAARASR
ncbi:MAG: helix-turn-helix transcriptional regulator [Euryarchaeota archaeon]|nr:helix-turn-helix transcriptional regulator [Euryarchaeota archaeon]